MRRVRRVRAAGSPPTRARGGHRLRSEGGSGVAGRAPGGGRHSHVSGDRHLLDRAVGAPAAADRLHAEVDEARHHRDRGDAHRRRSLRPATPCRGQDGGLPQRVWREWTAPAFEVYAAHPVPAGIDGEAATLEPPLRFHIRPAFCACASRAGIPAPHRRPCCPRASGRAHARWSTSPSGTIPRPARQLTLCQPNPRRRRADGHLGGRSEGAPQPRGGRGAAAQPADMLASHNDIEFRAWPDGIHGARTWRGRAQDRTRSGKR